MYRWSFAVTHAFKGARFEDGAIDVDVLGWLAAYRELVLDVARSVWRAENDGRQRLPRGFDDGFQLRLSNLGRGSALATVERAVPSRTQLAFEPDVYARAMRLVEGSVVAVSRGEQLPAGFPRSALPGFRRWGMSFRDDEYVELRDAQERPLATYTPEARAALLGRVDTSYEVDADEVGFVLATSIRAGRFELYRDQHAGHGVDVPLRPEDEKLVLDALAAHGEPRIHVVGLGAFTADGALVRFTRVDRVEPVERAVDNTPLWSAIAAISAAIPEEAWTVVPVDGALNHDHYV